MSPRGVRTLLVAVGLAVVGFAVGAAGSAWQRRTERAEPWRKLRVEHEGTEGQTTRTRVLFANPKLALQAVELARSPEGKPELAHVVLREGAELTAAFGKDGRPASLEGPDRSRALLAYKGAKARVVFVSPSGKAAGDKVVAVPVELCSALRLARAEPGRARPGDGVFARLGAALIGEAFAQDGDEPVTVRRDVAVELDILVPNAKASDAGSADVETSCAPFTCLPAPPAVRMPGRSSVRIGVTGSTPRSRLGKPPSEQALAPFRDQASAERRIAGRVLPDVAAVVGAVGVVGLACKSLELTWPICVKELGKPATGAGAAIHAVLGHEVEAGRQVLDARAEALYYEEQARAALDRETSIEICLGRVGYARACTRLGGRPFAREPMASAQRRVELRRGIGGAIEGSFIMTQADGADCKFSPSPRTSGPLRLVFDNERNSVTGSLKSNARGTRPNLTCSLGTANMGWSQNYGATATQSFTPAELGSGGKLPLRLQGTMNGTGGYSFSNCRSSSGVSANCPAGKSDSYSYRLEILGEIDLATQTGAGRILVHDAPLATQGTWRIPAEPTP